MPKGQQWGDGTLLTVLTALTDVRTRKCSGPQPLRLEPSDEFRTTSARRTYDNPMQTDRELDVSPQPDDTNGKDEKILSTPVNRSTPARMRFFLDAYSKTGRLLQACEAAGINHNLHYRKMQSDPTYRAAFEAAQQRVGQLLEDTAMERALAGDNQLLIVLLKRFRPEQYRERIVAEISGTIHLAERLKAAEERMKIFRQQENAVVHELSPIGLKPAG